MQVDWKPDNRPENAVEVALHTAAILRQMDDVAGLSELNGIWRAYQAHARDRRICRQIVECVWDKYRLMKSAFEDRGTR